MLPSKDKQFMPRFVQQIPNSGQLRSDRPWKRTSSVLNCSLALATAIFFVLGCGGGSGQKQSGSATKPTSARAGDVDLMNPEDDVMAGVGTPGARGTSSQNATKAGATKNAVSKSPAAGGSGSAAAAQAANAKGRWSVMLATFTQLDHVERANAFRTQLVRDYPELASAFVRRVGKGSAIVIGRFEGPQDAAAQSELKRVKAIERGKAKPFAGAMLVRTATDDASAATKPYDIRNLRMKYPKVRPLFTLQVAAWSTFGEKGVKYDDMRRAAERYCADLRAKGVDAWFHHDEDSETSIVTVGNFDRRAYDGQTTLFSPEVEDLMRRFPAHLLNGEPLMVPIDQSNPKGPKKPQPCRLVEVPEV
ncbi:MAG: hypothetical protein RL591_1423 [Planctomycetota bacterium]